jgi:lipopolysaccharide transport system permease protein
MQTFSASPVELVSSVWRHRRLILALTQREVLGRYRGSTLGIFWSFFHPLLMLSVFTFVFSVVFKARWGTDGGSKIEFALLLFAGLLMFNLFSECINRAPGLILANVNYVKKVVFPLEVLPWVSLGAALFHAAISFCVWLLAYMIFFGVPHLTVFYMPLIVLPFVMFLMGLSWALAALGVFLRDITQLIGVGVSALMFLSPIFYPASSLPEAYRQLLYLNPMTPVIEMTRDAMFWGNSPNMTLIAAYFAASALIAWLGFAWFQKTRKGFADVV